MTVQLLHPLERNRVLEARFTCDTPATHMNQQNEPRQECNYTLERDRGGVASAPLRVLPTFPGS